MRGKRGRRSGWEEQQEVEEFEMWRRFLMWDCESSLYDSFELRAFSTHFASRLADELRNNTCTYNCNTKPLRYFIANSPHNHHNHSRDDCSNLSEEDSTLLLSSGSKKRKNNNTSSSSSSSSLPLSLAIFHRFSSMLANACCYLLPSSLIPADHHRSHRKDAHLRHLLHHHHSDLLLRRRRRRRRRQSDECCSDEEDAVAAKLLQQIGEQQAQACVSARTLAALERSAN